MRGGGCRETALFAEVTALTSVSPEASGQHLSPLSPGITVWLVESQKVSLVEGVTRLELLLGAQHLLPVRHLSRSTCWTEVGTEDQRGAVTARHHTALTSGPNKILDQVSETLLTLLFPTRRPFQVLDRNTLHVSTWQGLSRTLLPPCSLHQPSSGQPGSSTAPADCGGLSPEPSL